MSILQDYEKIHKELGDEKWQQICDYCEKTGRLLDTVIYTESGWRAFKMYLEKESISKGPHVTVCQLLELLKEQVNAGNGDDIVLLSNYDDGNGFHALNYFIAGSEDIRKWQDRFHDDYYPENVIILG